MWIKNTLHYNWIIRYIRLGYNGNYCIMKSQIETFHNTKSIGGWA